MSLTPDQWLLAVLSAVMVGFSKCGLPGVGILVVPLMAMVFPPKDSVAVLLPMLIFADCFAVAFYRRHAQWNKIWGLLPWVVVGTLVAAWLLARIDNDTMKPILGWMVLGLIVLEYVRKRMGWHDVPHHPLFVAAMGFLGGFATTMGNVAGPIMTIYFLSRGLDKDKFIGTISWYFLLINCSKIPVYGALGMFTTEGLRFDLMMIPAIAIGALLGRWLLPRIPQKTFFALAMILAAIAAIRLILW